MDPHDLVTIERFLSLSDAAVARAMLESAGIPAVLADENAVRMTEGYAQGGVRLMVSRENADEATELLTESGELGDEVIQATGTDDGPVSERCRRCGSEEIYLVESRARSMVRVVAVAWLGILLINVANCGAAIAGIAPPRELFGLAYGAILVASAAYLLFAGIAPRKRCRNCGLEWRGTPRTA